MTLSIAIVKLAIQHFGSMGQASRSSRISKGALSNALHGRNRSLQLETATMIATAMGITTGALILQAEAEMRRGEFVPRQEGAAE